MTIERNGAGQHNSWLNNSEVNIYTHCETSRLRQFEVSSQPVSGIAKFPPSKDLVSCAMSARRTSSLKAMIAKAVTQRVFGVGLLVFPQ